MTFRAIWVTLTFTGPSGSHTCTVPAAMSTHSLLPLGPECHGAIIPPISPGDTNCPQEEID